ncbi:MAG: DMT family transporter [Gemmatimonadetes bacterium]|nr:DMT family transporter [Gemmatimonadota bacterium]
MSWAGPLIRFSTAPALAVAAWRLLFSVAFIALVLLLRRRAAPAPRLQAREWALAAAAGLLLAGHFWSWIASLERTSVASSVVLVSTQPIFVAALSALLLKERPARRQWAGILAAVAGALVIGWGDFSQGRSPLLGDLLAVTGAILVSGYYVVGRRLRPRLGIWEYTAIVYGLAAAALAATAAAHPAANLTGYPGRDWLIFLALAAGPMMLGHTGVNYALRYLPAYVANLALLGEPVGATIIAWALPGIRETPSLQTLVGGVLVLGGIAVGWRGGSGRRSDTQSGTGTAAGGGTGAGTGAGTGTGGRSGWPVWPWTRRTGKDLLKTAGESPDCG